ncbi:type II secretion system protein [Ornithinibacillus salinisoli]|uniref:Type II secretion system protein n=1 Tax=Ornithinibacillus salinisoli TaxID=1848459 RepID=A0ABW4W684_9BACI
MSRNEQGITLIELLATITILSIVGIIIWNVFLQGYNFSQDSMMKSRMQQETQLIVASLVNFHQKTPEPYKIENSECAITVSNSSEIKRFDHSQLCISSDFTGNVTPNNEDINLTITVEDKNDESNLFSMETILYRLKSGE